MVTTGGITIGTLAAMIGRRAANHMPHLVDLPAIARSFGWNSGAKMLEKAAVGEIVAGFGANSSTGVELSGFTGSLSGAFFSAAVAARAQQWPERSVVGVLDQEGFAASEVAERAPAPVKFLANGMIKIEPAKVMAILVYSKQLLAERGAAAILEREIRLAIGRGLDSAYVSRLAPGSAGGFAAGASALADLRTLTEMVIDTTGQDLLFTGAVDTCQRIATLAPGGNELFPLANLNGPGELKGAPLFPTDALTAGSLLAIDPSGIAASIDEITVEASASADMMMDSAPAMPANLVSMFHAGAIALRATCFFTCIPLRDRDVSAECAAVGWTEA